jgi:hypothetical protein
MSRPIIILSVIVALCCFTEPTSLYAQKKKVTTVHGELVELTSYVKDGIKPTGAAGKEIAMGSIGKGGALALLEKGTNRLFIVVPASPSDTLFLKRLTPYLGAKTFIKGYVTMRSSVRVITAEDIGKSLK